MIRDITKQIVDNLHETLNKASQSSEINRDKLREIVQMAIRKCDLVSREEFDAQTAVLAKTREHLKALEAQLAELQERIDKP